MLVTVSNGVTTTATLPGIAVSGIMKLKNDVQLSARMDDLLRSSSDGRSRLTFAPTRRVYQLEIPLLTPVKGMARLAL